MQSLSLKEKIESILIQLKQVIDNWESQSRHQGFPRGCIQQGTLDVPSTSLFVGNPREMTLACSMNESISIFHLNEGSLIASLPSLPLTIRSMAWSPDGQRLAFCSSRDMIQIWNVPTSVCTSLNSDTGSVNTLAWSSDGQRLASGNSDGSVQIWNTEISVSTLIIRGYDRSINTLAWSSDGQRLASGNSDGSIQIWNTITGDSTSILSGHTRAINSVAWSSNNQLLASGSHDRSIRIWDVQLGQGKHLLEDVKGAVTKVVFSQDDILLIAQTIAGEEAIHFWKTSNWQLIGSIPTYPSKIELTQNIISFYTEFQSINLALLNEHVQKLATSFTNANDKANKLIAQKGRFDMRVIALIHDLIGATTRADKYLRNIVDSLSNHLTSSAKFTSSTVPFIDFTFPSDASATSRVTLLNTLLDSIHSHDSTSNSSALTEAYNFANILLNNLATARNHANSLINVLATTFDLAQDLMRIYGVPQNLMSDLTNTKDIADELARSLEFAYSIIFKRLINEELINFPTFSFRSRDGFMITRGNSNNELAFWYIDVDTLIGEITGPITHYSNAKVVLIGETSVGKTCLGMALMGQSFTPQESTHGRTVWVLNENTVFLDAQQNEQRELLLWDMAGQQGYRVVHQLSFDDVAVALFIFDNLDETGSFGEVYYWARSLRQAYERQGVLGRKQKRFLVAARVDRGGLGISRERINKVIKELAFDGFYVTSAKEGTGIIELRQAIIDAVDWDHTLKVTSTDLFRQIKRFLMIAKDDGLLLSTEEELFRLFTRTNGTISTTGDLRSDFSACIDRVTSSGQIQRFSWGNYILLQPELLDAYASALVISARDEPDGLGAISKEKALAGYFSIPRELRDKISPENEQLLLIAMIEELIRRDLILTQGTQQGDYLIFPAQTMREHPGFPLFFGQFVRYDFEGAVTNLYSTLAVRLARSQIFINPEIYQNTIQYTIRSGGYCGIVLQNKKEGIASLTLYFSQNTPEVLCTIFDNFVADHLKDTITNREPIFRCPNVDCGLITIPSDAANILRERGITNIPCTVCETPIQLIDNQARLQISPSLPVEQINSTANRAREVDAWVTVRRATSNYDVFFSYNVEDSEEVYIVANKLIENGIMPWLYEWDEVKGQRFIPEITKAIHSCRKGIFLLGDNRIGKWQDEESDSLLAEEKSRMEFTVIPVILPDTVNTPDFPSFLRNRAWIDFRRTNPDPLGELIRAITGLLPYRLRSKFPE